MPVVRSNYPLHVVDVFAEAKYEGNQLAVVLEAEELSDREMQQIALEMNYAETSFITSQRQSDGGYVVRIFTPAQELPFAGHPTLGTAWVIRHHIETDSPPTIQLNLRVGKIPVSFEAADDGRELPWLTAPPVEFGRTIERDQMAAAVGLSQNEIDDRAPVQQLSAGISVVCVPLVSLDALKRARLDPAAFAPLAQQRFPPFVYLYCTQTVDPENDLCARFFFDAFGVREDSATGSATACLGAYLVKYRYLSKSHVSLRVEQGLEINRPSLLMLRAKQSPDGHVVRVGGNVIQTVRGELV